MFIKLTFVKAGTDAVIANGNANDNDSQLENIAVTLPPGKPLFP
jgi:hypothetical protein